MLYRMPTNQKHSIRNSGLIFIISISSMCYGWDNACFYPVLLLPTIFKIADVVPHIIFSESYSCNAYHFPWFTIRQQLWSSGLSLHWFLILSLRIYLNFSSLVSISAFLSSFHQVIIILPALHHIIFLLASELIFILIHTLIVSLVLQGQSDLSRTFTVFFYSYMLS